MQIVDKHRDLIRDLLIKSYEVATRSPDPSSQNGAVLYDPNSSEIIAEACNTFPAGIKITEERLNDRDLKLKIIDHAEASVLLTAFRSGALAGRKIEDLWLVCPWAACTGCAKYIIGFGIKHMITHKQGMIVNHSHWVGETVVSKIMFAESGVNYEEYDGLVGSCQTRRSGVLVQF